jgi:hypothetical protein
MTANHQTAAVATALDKLGWHEIAEDAIHAWCAKNWTSMVSDDDAGAIIRDALMVEAEFRKDVLAVNHEPIDPNSVDWAWLGGCLVEAVADRNAR